MKREESTRHTIERADSSSRHTHIAHEQPNRAFNTHNKRDLTLAPTLVAEPTSVFSHRRSMSVGSVTVTRTPSLPVLEQLAPALRDMGWPRLQRQPSLSPNQQTFSLGSSSPPLGSDIELEFPAAKPTVFQPKLTEIEPSFAVERMASLTEPGVDISGQQSRPVHSNIVLEPGLALPAVVGVVHAASGPARSVDAARQPGTATTLDSAVPAARIFWACSD